MPVAPENQKVGKGTKLIAILQDKKKYTCHHQDFKYYVSEGMEVQKVHWIVKSDEAAWMKPYILKNSRLRAQATNEFEKNFYKLANNAVFGKTMENLRKHFDIKIVTNDEQALRWANKPNFPRFTIIDEDTLALAHMRKTKIKFDRPFPIGPCVLELARLHMYRMLYDYIKTEMGR